MLDPLVGFGCGPSVGSFFVALHCFDGCIPFVLLVLVGIKCLTYQKKTLIVRVKEVVQAKNAYSSSAVQIHT